MKAWPVERVSSLRAMPNSTAVVYFAHESADLSARSCSNLKKRRRALDEPAPPAAARYNIATPTLQHICNKNAILSGRFFSPAYYIELLCETPPGHAQFISGRRGDSVLYRNEQGCTGASVGYGAALV